MQIGNQLVNVPEELKSIDQWVYHKNKVPYNPSTNRKAKPSEPDTGTSFKYAIENFDESRYDGLGLILSDTGLIGIDIDDCINSETGIITPFALEILSTTKSYTEVSPSGTGLHIFAFGDMPESGRKAPKYGLEMYKTGRYLTVTGNIFGECASVEDCSGEISEIYSKYFSKKSVKTVFNRDEDQIGEFEDPILIEAMKSSKKGAQINHLMTKGNENELYASQSEADLALCNHLAYWTKRNPVQMDRIFRTTALMRDKWDEVHFSDGSTYGQKTIETAVQECKHAYGETVTELTEQSGYVAYSVGELLHKELPPIKWIVEELVPEGLTLVAAPPKSGKSWWALDLCMSHVRGLPFLGRQTIKGNALYIALEDSDRRIQSRTKELMRAGGDEPAGFMCVNHIEPIGHGFEERLDMHVEKHSPSLIIIDTLEKIRPLSGSKDRYQVDYKDAGLLKNLAEKHKIAIVVIHHTRKSKDDTDPFAQISGSFGLLGAADTAMVIEKPKRSDTQATLYITGRDVERQELAIEFDTALHKWNYLFDHSSETRHLEEYVNNPIVQTIRELTSFGEWEGSTADLHQKIVEQTHFSFADNRILGKKIVDLIEKLQQFDGISYEQTRPGNVKNHRFIP